ncbi:28951_t:CDS:1, partial [Gigaspora margarita]
MSFVKKFISKQNTFTSEETYIEGWNETWKEKSKFKKFFRKLFKKDEIKEVVEKNFWGWDNIEEIEP